MSIPNSFSANTTIESAKVNQNFTDLGSEITASLPRDGQAGMSGQFKATDGTITAPGITFSSDTDTGFYRSGANTIAVAGTLTTNGTNKIDAFPAGTAMLFVQTSAPTGWTKSTTHNDKALRIVSGTASSGGSTAFSSVFAARTIATSNLPSHTHSFSGTSSSNGAHQHYVFNSDVGDASSVTGSDYAQYADTSGSSVQNYTIQGSATVPTRGLTTSSGDHTHTYSGTTSSIGSGTAMDFAVQYLDVILATKDA